MPDKTAEAMTLQWVNGFDHWDHNTWTAISPVTGEKWIIKNLFVEAKPFQIVGIAIDEEQFVDEYALEYDTKHLTLEDAQKVCEAIEEDLAG